MAHKKSVTPYFINEGKIAFWHDGDNDSCFGSYPEPLCLLKNIDVEILMEALGVTRIENIGRAIRGLRRLHGLDDIKCQKAFCDEHDIYYEYIEE